METYKQKFTTLQSEIFRLFCVKTGQKLNQRKIAKFLNVSPTAVAKSLSLLEKEKLLKIEKNPEMNLNLIQFNRDNQFAIQLKRVENLKLFYESNILNKLLEQYPGTTIILFGSYTKGEDLYNSDIDIAIIGTKKKGNIINGLEKEIRISTYLNFKEINKELKENIFNGIILLGGIEL